LLNCQPTIQPIVRLFGPQFMYKNQERALLKLSGVQFFPVTPFDAVGRLDTEVLAAHIARGLDAGPGAIFAACGTGEFHSLSPDEHAQVTTVAVGEANGRVPVFVGAGGPVGAATAMARTAASRGADGLLILPPYLVTGTPEGLVEYTRAVAEASDLPVIVYNRRESLLDADAAGLIAQIPNVIGFKDGLGNLDLLAAIRVEITRRTADSNKVIQYFNGMPTAETSAQAYRAIGIDTYSSAVFGFVPELSLAFYRALGAGDEVLIERLLTDFFVPFARLRSTLPGGAVSLVKLGVSLSGLPVGRVRPPLLDPPPHVAEALLAVIQAGQACLEVQPAP
jgi:5-dehydro-4-deoxyglucarate dehydratase